MKAQLLLSLLVVSLLSACSSAPSVEQKNISFQQDSQARIRLYGQNGNPSVISYTEQGKKVRVNIGGSLGDAFGSLLGTKKSESIGMPSTRISENLANKNVLLSHAFFRELVVPANVVINIEAAVIPVVNINNNPTSGSTRVSQTQGCSHTTQFTAEANKDYEVASNGCLVIIYEITQSSSGIRLKELN